MTLRHRPPPPPPPSSSLKRCCWPTRFLDILLSHIDTLDALSGGGSAGGVVGSVLPSGSSTFIQCERQLLIRLLLNQPQVTTIRQRTAKDVLESFKPDRFSTQPAIRSVTTSQPPSELATALLPLRNYVTARHPKPPPPAVAEWMALVRGSSGAAASEAGVALDAPITPTECTLEHLYLITTILSGRCSLIIAFPYFVWLRLRLQS